MTAHIIVMPRDWFARQRRDKDPAERHECEIIPIEANPVALHMRDLRLAVARARRTQESVRRVEITGDGAA